MKHHEGWSRFVYSVQVKTKF